RDIILESEVLPLSGSDHYPVSLSISFNEPPKKSPFKFELMWLRDLSLHAL
ncbi:hypothetical protein KI387_003997, partial [Taxus chinensis]